jgi:Uma2 family endonuclease
MARSFTNFEAGGIPTSRVVFLTRAAVSACAMGQSSAYASAEALSRLAKGELRSFPRLCPDFVIELLSGSDAIAKLKQKMEDWMTNRAALGWLVDPYARQVIVYRQGEIPVVVDGDSVSGSGPVRGFVLNLSKVWARFED